MQHFLLTESTPISSHVHKAPPPNFYGDSTIVSLTINQDYPGIIFKHTRKFNYLKGKLQLYKYVSSPQQSPQ